MRSLFRTISAAFLLAAVVGALVAGGAVAIDGPTFANESVTVDNDTYSVAVTATNVTNGPVDVEVYGISNGNETLETTTTIDAVNTSTTKEFSVNSTAYDSYRVVVSESDSVSQTQTVESLTIDTLVSGTGGGGFLPGTSSDQMSIAVLVLAAGALLVMKEE
ncbi:hypothetical protein ACERIT_03795 [Halopenitus sp. H-Gu1]|uniref:hypothetical protein n=1 Tax=Halopenitus sp. H-Gu1 TaxID=3242697 RepID=UPI00359D7990